MSHINIIIKYTHYMLYEALEQTSVAFIQGDTMLMFKSAGYDSAIETRAAAA